jgi:hypothetical protein
VSSEPSKTITPTAPAWSPDQPKPCPFCGKEPIVLGSLGVVCDNVNCALESVAMSLEAWNQRPADAEPTPVAWMFRHVDTDTRTVAILTEPKGTYAGFEIVPLFLRGGAPASGDTQK